MKGRGGLWFLVAALTALALVGVLAFPLPSGLVAQRLLSRGDPAACAAALKKHAGVLCEDLARTREERASCEAAILTLPAPEMCEPRLHEVAQCARGGP
jgi:hypothetical protein